MALAQWWSDSVFRYSFEVVLAVIPARAGLLPMRDRSTQVSRHQHLPSAGYEIHAEARSRLTLAAAFQRVYLVSSRKCVDLFRVL